MFDLGRVDVLEGVPRDGPAVDLVGAVGEDFPDQYMEPFQHFGIDLEGLEKRQGSKTFRWHGKYHENMNSRDTVDVQLNVLGEAPPPVPESYKDSQFIFLANTHPAAQKSLLDSFPKRELVVADRMLAERASEEGGRH